MFLISAFLIHLPAHRDCLEKDYKHFERKMNNTLNQK